MAEPSLEEQVRNLQAQLAAVNARVSCSGPEAVHPMGAYSGTEMIQALLKSADEDLTDVHLKQVTGFLSLIRQHEPIGSRPGGLPSATIGLVMHRPPSQNKSNNDFFDYQNPLLKLLVDNSITASQLICLIGTGLPKPTNDTENIQSVILLS